jgi:D-Tyr-tRNAtyr deacylase
MKLESSAVIGGVVKSAIKTGLLVLLAVEESDTAEVLEWLSGKIAAARRVAIACGRGKSKFLSFVMHVVRFNGSTLCVCVLVWTVAWRPIAAGKNRRSFSPASPGPQEA